MDYDIDSIVKIFPSELHSIDSFCYELTLKWPWQIFQYVFKDFDALKEICFKLGWILKNIQDCGNDGDHFLKIDILLGYEFVNSINSMISKQKLHDSLLQKLIDESFMFRIEKDLNAM